ncbi:putative ribonuclease H protein [Trifolium medium]|uniref:Putative ribonuclease H protein n=1 Tax=Trifolium medium TaxID=97028 RepID=A0A392N1K3_9FABA|nr:putative ribonuclease H protein [Trifolium medium]
MKDSESWLLNAVYASPRENERSDTWNKLYDLAENIQERRLMLGDFNDITCPDEKKGGSQVDFNRCLLFSNWINDFNLVEVDTTCTKFTWRGPKWNGRDCVFKKIYRILCNVAWRLKYHESFAKVLPRVQSDHHPITKIHNHLLF